MAVLFLPVAAVRQGQILRLHDEHEDLLEETCAAAGQAGEETTK